MSRFLMDSIIYSNPRYGYSLPRQPATPQKYPEDIQCVLPSTDPHRGAIFISNIEAASNPETLEKHNIKAVMTCAKGYDKQIPQSRISMFQYFPLEDKQNCELTHYLHKGCDFIKKALETTNILVHCIAGVSRSVSMVIAYLIREKEFSYDSAYQEIKSRRKIISPNDGFIRQLKIFERTAREYKNRQNKNFQNHKNNVQEAIPINRDIASTNQPYKTPQRQYNNFTSETLNHTNLSRLKQNIDNEEDEQSQISKTKNESRYLQYNSKTALRGNSRDQQDLRHGYLRNYSTILTKSSTFIQESRFKTPEKVGKKTVDIKQETYNGMSDHYKKMNEELNQKIKQIHQKYQKQRQELMNKGSSHVTTGKDRSTSFNAYNNYSDNNYYRKSTQRQDNYSTVRYNNSLNRYGEGNKYLYEDKYERVKYEGYARRERFGMFGHKYY